MAAVISVKVQLPEKAILGQPIPLVIAVTNSDATTAASVTDIALSGIPASAPVTIQAPSLVVSGSRSVAASSTIYFPAGLVIHGSERNGGAAVPSPVYEVSAVVTMSDGQVIPSPLLTIAPNRPVVEAPADGAARFDWGGTNTYMLAAVPATGV